MIKKLSDGRYRLDFYPAGSAGPRIVRVRSSKKELKVLQAELELDYQRAPDRFTIDRRRLSDLVNLWYAVHGSTLRDARYRLSRTLAVCEALADPSVDKFSAADFSRYREKRLQEVSVSTVKGAFRKAVERSGIELPDGQLTHVLRHTFASHFLINGGDILALQRILGHSDLKVTMRYAHLAPDYMARVRDLSPI